MVSEKQIVLSKEHLRKHLLQAEKFNTDVLQAIHDTKWLYIWVPKEYGGLGCSFSEGLKILEYVSQIDGSLGWFVTLCSGANCFSRNLKPETAKKIFMQPNVCFGGSGLIGGTAEKVGDSYVINGEWTYATGAPYLTHFTLNAQLIKDGTPIFDDSGEPQFRSFILDASQVKLIPSWKSMGMVATASHGFRVVNQYVHKENSFIYNEFYTPNPLNRIPFEIFADLTLLVNYLGMANHFLEKSLEIRANEVQTELQAYLAEVSQRVNTYAVEIEQLLSESKVMHDSLASEIHAFGEETVAKMMFYIARLYQLSGIKASRTGEEINQVFRDFFTATQHANFRAESGEFKNPL